MSLVDAWNASRIPLNSWVRAVEAAFNESGMDLLDASEVTGSTGAELEAVIRLALLDDKTLELVSSANPSMTTWFLLTEIPNAEIPSVLEAAGGMSGPYSDFQRMARAVSEITDRADISAIRNLDPHLFDFVLKKATAYSAWPSSSKNYKALRDFAARRRSGRPLTARQTAYARGLLIELVEASVIQVPSPDGDDAQCTLVLKAVA